MGVEHGAGNPAFNWADPPSTQYQLHSEIRIAVSRSCSNTAFQTAKNVGRKMIVRSQGKINATAGDKQCLERRVIEIINVLESIK